MKKNNLKSAPVTDLELLDEAILYLNSLCPILPHHRLQHHCIGALASLFELSFYLRSKHLTDYGNNEK